MTSNLDHMTMNEKKLEQLLDIYGADLSKMPEPIAKEIKDIYGALSQDDYQAKVCEPKPSVGSPITKEKIDELMLKAERLDQALDHHKPLPSWNIEALEDQIFENAFVTEQVSNAKVISFEKRKRSSKKNKPVSGAKRPSDSSEFFTLKSTGLIAASLLAGMLMGSFGGLDHLLYEEGATLIASTSLMDDVLYLGTEYSLETADFLKN